MQTWGARWWLFLALLLGAQASARADSGPFDTMLASCDKKLESYDSQARSAKLTNDVLLITGAIIAAFGSALGGFLRKDNQRKVAAVVGAIGAVLAVFPKTLPDPAQLRATYYTAGKHRDAGVRVMVQLNYFQHESFRRLLDEYVVARFASCSAIQPASEVPDPPTDDVAEATETAKTRDVVMASPAREQVERSGQPERVVMPPPARARGHTGAESRSPGARESQAAAAGAREPLLSVDCRSAESIATGQPARLAMRI
jgi:hypothetical protein